LIVQARTQNSQGSAELNARVAADIEKALGHRREKITRIDVLVIEEDHVATDGSHRICCVMEARLDRRAPVAVMHRALSSEDALTGATGRLVRLVDSALLAGDRRRS
jgi:hypothetical protein